MYEIRKAGNTFRIYDKDNMKYVAHSNNEDTANRFIGKLLRSSGFEGDIPQFFLTDKKYGFDLDKKHDPES